MILADLGADVIRVDRPGGQPLTGGPQDFLNRGRPSVALDLKHPDGVATVLRLVETADVLVEGLRPGVTERLGVGSRRVPQPQPTAGLRPDDRLGPDRPAGEVGRARPQLRRHHGCAVRAGSGSGPAAIPDQPGRRLRRRLDVPGDRCPRRAAGGPRLRARPGDRRGHRRRHRPPQRDDRQPPGQRDGDRAARRQPARRRRPVLRPLRDRRRPPPLGRAAGAAVLRRLRRPPRHRRQRARPRRPGPAPRPARPHRRDRAHPHAGRVDRGLRRQRRLRGTGAAAQRGGAAPAPRRPPGVRRPVRRPRAGAGAAVLPHRVRASPRRHPPLPASTPAPPWPPGASPTSTT